MTHTWTVNQSKNDTLLATYVKSKKSPPNISMLQLAVRDLLVSKHTVPFFLLRVPTPNS